VLYINLDRATERRRNLETQLHQHMPHAAAFRIPAVDGQAQDQNDAHMLSPYTRFLLRHRHRATTHAQIETWGAVGCSLSHVMCWEWLLDQPASVADALVLEDDACFTDGFTSAWSDRIATLRTVPHRLWDVLLLGHVQVQNMDRVTVHGQELLCPKPGEGAFFGTHAYLVTRQGAAILRQYAFPLEVQVDAYMLVLQQIGLLRLYLLDDQGGEVVQQCIGSTEPGILHGFRPPQPSISQVFTRHCPYVHVVILGATAVVLLALLVRARYQRCPSTTPVAVSAP
jgi:GR25 family glycosyltransferase involved in LPS biosynthesis